MKATNRAEEEKKSMIALMGAPAQASFITGLVFAQRHDMSA